MNTSMTNTEKRTGDLHSTESTYQASFVPQFDIWEGEDELRLYGDMPGVMAESLDIRFENRELTIHGKVEPRQVGARLLDCEYEIGDFHRSFAIGEAIDAEKISAELHNGVLVLHLPKCAEVKPRRITVRRD